MTKQLKVIYTHWINISADPPKVKSSWRKIDRVISVTVPAAQQRVIIRLLEEHCSLLVRKSFLAGFHVAMGLWKESV
ncbi:hypothetical protein [Ruminococcus gauvreauii]|uniref:Uncharacterized protein n=1 Tax=Ruminococcus gauvreauii TaxID=438033 RepID=A0ABY5VJB2_9FIRM|nr:hypothetical protein [Ruminococcus gauvreauii]UWP60143.1 hypothetical protein NQ502_03550 [Ruminococcus gauvreauii]